MAAKKYFTLLSGIWNLISGVVVSAGAGNDGDLVALDATGKLDASVMPSGFGQNTVSAVASEALSANDLVNIWNNAGVVNVRKADGTSAGKEVVGFVKAGVSLAGTATIYMSGNSITGLSGLTPGARYYMSTTPGALTATPLSGSGNVHQYVGDAVGATELQFRPDDYVQLP